MSISLQDSTLFRQACYGAGQWIDKGDEGTIEVANPATDEVIGVVPSLGQGQVGAVIAAAAEGFEVWKQHSIAERAQVLRQWFDLMHEHKEDLAKIMTLEQGKPINESRGEIDYAASYIEWFAEEAKRGYGQLVPAVKAHQRIVVRPEPVGVSAAITPWNFPAAMITRKAGAALAAGCSMVVKPSSLTPFTALAMAELGERAGLPAGVFSVVTGSSADIGEVLTASSTIKKLSFTGSTSVGRKLMAMCADNLHKLSLELGGNAPFVVFDDADVELAVKGAVASKFRNTGQTCICPNRFLVQTGVHDAFVDKLSAALSELKVGDGFDEDVKQTSLINAGAVEKVQRHYDDALQKGASCALGDRPGKLAHNRIDPIILTGVNRDMQLWQEETFGPLAPVMRFETEQEGIEAANDTPFGLAAYFYAQQSDRVWRVSEALQAGMVGANEGGISNAMAPFGGIDQSGFGREGGREGMAEYQQLKYICFGQAGAEG
ncbi:NAD-dependent succinate-semialdehyde dehydrogenase [Gilvimarinus xylanilyticus]|uniref:NAD-dependent succinate-semialdehyde dehydrogenase n=1 Tax=Gilvimarinus xylanilyticus TaxID=2944139 RepID=A0A9X2HX70_9GAMM|nr:NAD-dependent succinate-semialdehyde dehydrogenase [Gilvimarinus xylanilyticus]MCP8898689.1 NAD-dependent succinate-semialdehyde dehydrogenase [Gilvimarinus xylanilyticus]